MYVSNIQVLLYLVIAYHMAYICAIPLPPALGNSVNARKAVVIIHKCRVSALTYILFLIAPCSLCNITVFLYKVPLSILESKIDPF